jgi:cardiolipin synthase (CMP-forming)
VLSLSRVPLGALLWAAGEHRGAWLGLVVVAGATDLADGWVARRSRAGDRELGALLDPICDKVFLASACASAAVAFDVPVTTLLLLGARELVLVPAVALYGLLRGRLRRPADFRAAKIGKLTTGLQAIALLHALVTPRGAVVSAAIAGAAGLLAAAHYIVRFKARVAR